MTLDNIKTTGKLISSHSDFNFDVDNTAKQLDDMNGGVTPANIDSFYTAIDGGTPKHDGISRYNIINLMNSALTAYTDKARLVLVYISISVRN